MKLVPICNVNCCLSPQDDKTQLEQLSLLITLVLYFLLMTCSTHTINKKFPNKYENKLINALQFNELSLPGLLKVLPKYQTVLKSHDWFN